LTEEIIRSQILMAFDQLCLAGSLQPGARMVIGCSTSEILGGRIGQGSSPETGEWVARACLDACAAHGLIPAFQCCEHLNRALVLSRPHAAAAGYTIVSAIPQPKAGGSVASAAYKMMPDPVLCEKVCADAGMDIGDTLIGMHLHPVAVPVRAAIRRIGEANLVMAYTRPPYIGGERAVYKV
jgi:uncharacterized protein (TIGR01440 family)